LRAYIAADERYPVYYFDDEPNKYNATVEVPDDLFERNRKAYEEFDAVQDELHKYYNSVDRGNGIQ
jgi:hypothetical protein